MNNGKFLISLDFELIWGVKDKRTIHSYGDAILGVKSSLDQTLNTFKEKSIRATFASVGFLFYKNKIELLKDLPQLKPSYVNPFLSPYINLEDFLNNNENYYLGKNIIDRIRNEGLHEIATHTHSHYYCLEEGQTPDQFRIDIEKAIEVAEKSNIQIDSIVFPRNQYNDSHLKVCKKLGISSYRGTENHKIYKSSKGDEQSLAQRFMRLLDSYINLTGHHCYSLDSIKRELPINLPSSRFLRSYNIRLSLLEDFKLNRIKKSMTYAAKNNLVYHIWWHPHNFGRNTDQNIKMLEKILDHYLELNVKYDFESVTMQSLSNKLINSQ
jgi:peptidoglycan/xylan/chitin deacetylase (PgdA/CDA1 family)